MTLLEEIAALKPGQGIRIGMAWDGKFYVVRTKTTPGSFTAGVQETISEYCDTFEEAYASPTKEHR